MIVSGIRLPAVWNPARPSSSGPNSASFCWLAASSATHRSSPAGFFLGGNTWCWTRWAGSPGPTWNHKGGSEFWTQTASSKHLKLFWAEKSAVSYFSSFCQTFDVFDELIDDLDLTRSDPKTEPELFSQRINEPSELRGCLWWSSSGRSWTHRTVTGCSSCGSSDLLGQLGFHPSFSDIICDFFYIRFIVGDKRLCRTRSSRGSCSRELLCSGADNPTPGRLSAVRQNLRKWWRAHRTTDTEHTQRQRRDRSCLSEIQEFMENFVSSSPLPPSFLKTMEEPS